MLNIAGNNYFQAGTYSDDTMAHISVSLDGEGEWWADTNNKENSTSAYMQTRVGSGQAYSNHHADNNRGGTMSRKSTN